VSKNREQHHRRRKPHDDILTTAFVRGLVATQFPEWADIPVSPVEVDGWDNTTFRLGTEMAVRLPSGPAYAAQVSKEQEWLPRLAPLLPLPIPIPLAEGRPSEDFPYPWSVYRWIDGDIAQRALIDDVSVFAEDLADFLLTLQRIDTIGGPPPGQHSYFRGCSVTFDDPTRFYRTPGNWAVRDSVAKLGDEIDAALAIEVWEAALAAGEPDRPVWVHGDVASSNLLVLHGRLSAVIDWGCSAFGDPACDLGIAWTFFADDSREAFRDRLSLDRDTWARARGWQLWVPLYRLADLVDRLHPQEDAFWRRIINEILEDHVRYG
jgi:aminoglycoside phosphotransferase (APT) family kinase protein